MRHDAEDLEAIRVLAAGMDGDPRLRGRLLEMSHPGGEDAPVLFDHGDDLAILLRPGRGRAPVAAVFPGDGRRAAVRAMLDAPAGLDAPATWERVMAGGRDLPACAILQPVATLYPRMPHRPAVCRSRAESAAGYVDAFTRDPDAGIPPDISFLVHSACRRHLVDVVRARMPTEAASLAAHAALAGDLHVLSVDDIVALAVCSGLPNPSWVEQAVRMHPVLLGLFRRPWSSPGAPSPWLLALSRGAKPLDVLRGLLSDPMLDGHESVHGLPAAALRSLSGVSLRRLCCRDGSPVRWLRTFHLAAPTHRSLDAIEVAALCDADTLLRPHRLHQGLDLAKALSHRGRVRPLPDGFADALRSMAASIAVIRSVLDHGGDAHDLASRVAFPDRRRHDALVRICAEWHAGVIRWAAAKDALRVDVRIRRAGRGGARDAAAFPHVIEASLDVEGVSVTPLRSHMDYMREGEGLRHCVGSYGTAASRGSVVGFALRSDDGVRSTLAWASGDDGNGFLTLDHRGPDNAMPTQGHLRAAAALAGLLSPTSPAVLDFEGLRVPGTPSPGLWTGEVPTPLDRDDGLHMADLTPEERGRLAAIEFRNVAQWLSRGEVALGPDGLLARLAGETAPGPGAAAAA